MTVSRRTALVGAASAGLCAALAKGLGQMAYAEIAPSTMGALRERWVDIVTGRKLISRDDAPVSAAIAQLDKAVDGVMADLLPNPGTRTSVLRLADLSQANSKYITTTARASRTLAMAWATPRSKHYRAAGIAKHAVDALSDFVRLRYNPSQAEYGNWWDWEIGASRAVADAMCLLHDQLSSEILEQADDDVRHFVPDPWKQFMLPRPKQVSTGANRVDLCQAAIVSCLATGNVNRLKHAVAGLPATWAYVTDGDGFYRDGSFIQHMHVPYTGSYGGVLLNGLSALFAVLSGSELNIPEEEREGIYRAIDEAIVPVMVDGQVLAAVRGRSVSRVFESGASHGGAILGAMLLLAEYAPQELGNHWRATCRGWLERNNFDDFFNTSNIVRLSLMRLALAGPRPAEPLSKPKMFPSMDRLMHRGTGWMAAIAMCSNRISWYECGNGENELGSRTGSGMRYLYLPGRLDQYEDAFWPTMDRTAPPGTTVDAATLVPKAGGEWGEKTPPNEWTGGLAHESLSVAGMHLISPDESGLSARKAWIGTEWGLIELVCDVKTKRGPAITVVEHRKLSNRIGQRLSVDGQPIEGERQFKAPKRARLNGVGSYVFLSPVALTAKVEERSGSWADINKAKREGSDELHHRYYATMQVSHAASDAAAWVLIPEVPGEKAADEPVKVVRNDAAAQIIEVGSDVRANVIWASGTYQGWLFGQPLIALSRQTGPELTLVVAEPTQQAEEITLTVPGRWKLVDGTAVLAHVRGGTQVVVPVAGLQGRSVVLRLRRPGPTTSPTRGSSSLEGKHPNTRSRPQKPRELPNAGE